MGLCTWAGWGARDCRQRTLPGLFCRRLQAVSDSMGGFRSIANWEWVDAGVGKG